MNKLLKVQDKLYIVQKLYALVQYFTKTHKINYTLGELVYRFHLAKQASIKRGLLKKLDKDQIRSFDIIKYFKNTKVEDIRYPVLYRTKNTQYSYTPLLRNTKQKQYYNTIYNSIANYFVKLIFKVLNSLTTTEFNAVVTELISTKVLLPGPELMAALKQQYEEQSAEELRTGYNV